MILKNKAPQKKKNNNNKKKGSQVKALNDFKLHAGGLYSGMK